MDLVAARRARENQPFVGRADELDLLDHTLSEVERGPPVAIEVVGEPGIGKTRLLAELAFRAELRGHLVLAGSASELEQDLPFSVFVHALDEYVESLDPNLLFSLDRDVQAELAQVFPALSAFGRGNELALQNERYRSHRAVRALLEQLARQTRPLVLALDDFHWADSASVELFGALLRRPPAAAVLIVVALRPRQVPKRFAAALERAQRTGALTRVELGALSSDEARAFLGDGVDAADSALLYQESGGNPFYLEQLVRAAKRAGAVRSGRGASLADLDIPPTVAAALSEELALLSDSGRLMLEGAAVAGDPFQLELAAAAADASETAVMDVVDELLELELVRTTDVPRRFRFRHPLIRRAVYEASAGGWRLGAHERCAEALAARGAPAAARAPHVERSARQGDTAAVDLLREAGDAVTRLAPESAAHWFAAALRLLPQTAPVEDRVELLLARARALAAAGHFAESHEAALAAAVIVPGQSGLRTTVATACAGIERLLGRYEHAHTRLAAALRSLPQPASAESAELLTELTLNEFYRSHYDAMHGWATRAVDAAKAVADPTLIAGALGVQALASAMTGPTGTARSHRAEAAAFVDELCDEELSLRPDAAGWLAIAEVYLDLYAEADAHASRALELARASGRGDPLHRLYPVLPRIWFVRGKLAQAAELLDATIEAGRLLGSPPALAGNLFNRSAVALATGDLKLALATAEEAADLTRNLDDGFVSAWAAVRLAAVLLETGHPAEAVETLLTRTGGEELTLIPGSWRAYSLELLTRCWLAMDRPSEAAHAGRLAEATATAVQLPLAGAWADRAVAAIDLHSGNTARAAECALASARAAQDVGAPIEEARSRTLAGQAFARAGNTNAAVTELRRAAAAFDACGALRYRESAERELGKLRRRPYRRSRAGTTDGRRIESLTDRELQLARLVVDRKTNPEIAAELFLSQKTVETHLRNIFRKMNVNSRVELARAVERADRTAEAFPA